VIQILLENPKSLELLPVARNPFKNRAKVIERLRLEPFKLGRNLEIGGGGCGKRKVILAAIPYRPNAAYRASAVA
jgi:hypothetical protein